MPAGLSGSGGGRPAGDSDGALEGLFSAAKNTAHVYQSTHGSQGVSGLLVDSLSPDSKPCSRSPSPPGNKPVWHNERYADQNYITMSFSDKDNYKERQAGAGRSPQRGGNTAGWAEMDTLTKALAEATAREESLSYQLAEARDELAKAVKLPVSSGLGNPTLHTLDLLREMARANVVGRLVTELNANLLEDNIRNIQNAALGGIRQAMVRLAKGHIGALLDVWRVKKTDDLKQSAVMEQALRQVEAASYAGKGKMSGMALMKQIVVRISRYDIASRVDCWKQNVLVDALCHEMEVTIQANLAQMAVDLEERSSYSTLSAIQKEIQYVKLKEANEVTLFEAFEGQCWQEMATQDAEQARLDSEERSHTTIEALKLRNDGRLQKTACRQFMMTAKRMTMSDVYFVVDAWRCAVGEHRIEVNARPMILHLLQCDIRYVSLLTSGTLTPTQTHECTHPRGSCTRIRYTWMA